MAKDNKFVGFYWTQPESLAKRPFTFGDDVGEAAKQSRTIRYQRKLTADYVKGLGGVLVAEFVHLDVPRQHRSPSLATPPPLQKAAETCRQENAALLYVEFWKKSNARAHATIIGPLDDIKEMNIATIGLDPRQIEMDDVSFDPRAHFNAWKKKLDERRKHVALEAEKAMRASQLGWLALDHPTGADRYKKIADDLNRGGIKTKTGKEWTAKNVKMFLERRRQK